MSSAWEPASALTPQDAARLRFEKPLLGLTRDLELQAEQARREYVRRVLKSREFFRGNQYIWWDANVGNFRAPTQTGGLLAGASPAQAQNLYVINIYQGFAMSLIALLTANHPTQRFFPAKADEDRDRRAADKANEYLKIWEKRSKQHERVLREAYLMWCDGTFGTYVHTIADGNRFGWRYEDILEEREDPVGYTTYRCMGCGNLSGEGGSCPTCGVPFGPESEIPPPTVPRSVVVGQKKIPKSRVVAEVVSGLELHLPPTAKDQAEYPFIIRKREIPKAAIRATYPDLAKKIANSANDGTGDMLEIKARRQLKQGLTVDNRNILWHGQDDVTFKEVWLRPWAYYQLDSEEERDALTKEYPDGLYVAFANNVCLEVRNENLDDHWRICHAMPGEGQIREPIGGTLIQIQEIVNDLYNITRDVIEYTLPATFADNEVLDVKKWGRSNVMPGAVYNVRARANRAVQDSFWQTQPGQLPQYTASLMGELRTDIPQFTAGLFPASFGGGTPGNSTASGISMERDAAMGRIGIYWRVLKEHHADVAPLIVTEFARNGQDPEVWTEQTEGGSFINFSVTPQDISSGEIQAFCEATEDYPTTWPQRQGLLMQFMQNPIFQPAVAKLSNLDHVKRTLGATIELPGELAYRNQWAIIEQLIMAQPQPVMGPDGQPVIGLDGQPQMQPSILPMPLDDNGPMFEACIDFDQSARGQQLRQQNPAGYQNFLLHALARKQALMPPPPIPGGAPPPPGEQGPPPGGPPPGGGQ